MIEDFRKHIKQNTKTIENLIIHKKIVGKIIISMTDCLKRGCKILICGNGGSAADAQHLSAELLVRLKPELSRKPLPAITLAQDTSTLTACGNDFNFNDIFLRSFQALSNKKDVLLVISTSGN